MSESSREFLKRLIAVRTSERCDIFCVRLLAACRARLRACGELAKLYTLLKMKKRRVSIEKIRAFVNGDGLAGGSSAFSGIFIGTIACNRSYQGSFS
jgi:hypothetical protein